MAVATNLSFTKTSEELFVSQPAISKQISLMEKELGVKLFIRNNKKTTLTKAGELYYEFFREYKKELRIPCTRPRRCSNRTRKLYMWVSWKDGIWPKSAGGAATISR